MAQPRSSAALFLALVGIACSTAGEDTLGTSRQAASTPFANDKTAYDYFIGKGLTNFQAAAVVGNLDQESGIDPTIHQAGGGVGRGIAQWSAGARWDTTPNDNVVAFAAQKGQSATSLSLQLDFIWYELTMFPEYGLTELKATSNVTDATQVFEDKFEGCVYANYPECALPSRVDFAKGVLAAYGADTGQGGQGGGGGGGSGGQAGASAGGGNAGTAGTSASGAGGAGGATAPVGGAGMAGTSPVTSAGTSSSAGSSQAGSPPTAGGPGVAGAPAAAGATSGGTPAFANTATSANEASCAFSPPSSQRGTVWLGLVALASFAWRRRRSSSR